MRGKKNREVNSSIELSFSRDKDLELDVLEETYSQERERVIAIYNALGTQLLLLDEALELNQAEIDRHSQNVEGLRDPNVVFRLREDRGRLEGIKDQAENNLSDVQISMVFLNIAEEDILALEVDGVSLGIEGSGRNGWYKSTR